MAEDFLRDLQVRQWLDGVEPVWTQLTFDSLRALRQKPRRLVSPRSKSPLISVPMRSPVRKEPLRVFRELPPNTPLAARRVRDESAEGYTFTVLPNTHQILNPSPSAIASLNGVRHVGRSCLPCYPFRCRNGRLAGALSGRPNMKLLVPS